MHTNTHTHIHIYLCFLIFVEIPFKSSVKCSAFKVTLIHPVLLFTWHCVVPLPCSHQLELIFTIFETSS